MSLRARRFAGARLAAQPLQTIPEQLQTALQNLRSASLTTVNKPVSDDFPDYIGRHRQVRNSTKKVHLMADPRPADLANFIPEDLSNTPANLEALEQLVAHPPRAVYDLSWDVDGNYAAESGVGRRESMRIAREAEKGWQEVIPLLEEGSLVKNTPLGAAQGDYERADLYMKYGFGPVQENGLQFGQVLGGKIVPISPTIPMPDYVKHLAERAKSGGESELFGQLNDNALALQKLTGDVEAMRTKREVSGAQDDYDSYEDYGIDYDDYEPTIDDFNTREENVRQVQQEALRIGGGLNNGGINAPIDLRRMAKNQVDPNYLVNEVEAPTANNIEQLRQAQIQLNQNVTPNSPLAVLDEVGPARPLPQMIPPGETTAPPRDGVGIRQSGRLPSGGMGQLSPDNRRRLLAARMRNDASFGNQRDPASLAIDARDMAKRNMVDMNRREDGGIGRVMQEQYNTQDVENLRRVQEAHARNVDSDQFGQQPNFLENRGGPPVNPNFVQHGDRIQNRRALTPQQQQAQLELEPLNSAEADIRAELDIFEGGMRNMNNRGRALRQQRGFGLDGLTDGVRPSSAMPGREALSVLQQENSQPGTVERPRLAQALVNLQQIRDRGFQAVRNAGAPQRALLEEANYGPAAPIQRVTASRVTPPNRPAPRDQRRANRMERWNTAPLVPSVDDIPF